MASNSTSLYSSNYPSSSPYTLTASVVENSYSVTNNTSNVTITATIASGGVYYSGYSTPTMSIQYKDNNAQTDYVAKASEQISSVTSSNPSRTVSWTGDVVHKDDGTLTATVKAVWSYKASGTGYAPKSGEVEVTLTLTTIPRAGGVSISPASGTISTTNGTNIFTATVTPQSTSFYHRISATCNNTSVMTAVWAEDSSNKGYITDTSLLTALGNNTSGTVTVTVQTYDTKSTSGTLIGTKTATASVSVNTSAIKPSLTSVSIAINSTPISGYLVAGYSTANVNATVAAGYGATSCTTSVTLSRGSMATASVSGTGAKTLATNAMASSTSDYTLTATITAKDGRGGTAKTTATYTVKGYTQPSVSITAYRVAAANSTTADEAGTYAYITYSATPKAIGNNSIQSITASYSGSVSGTLSGSPSWVALAENQSITLLVTASDRVASSTLTATVAVAIFPLDLYQENGHIGAAIGGVAEADRTKIYQSLWIEGSDGNPISTRVVGRPTVSGATNPTEVDLHVSAAGNSGMWSPTGGYWIVYRGPNGGVAIPAVEGIGIGGAPPTDGWTNMYQNIRFGNNATPTQTRYYATNGYVNLKADTSVSAARTITLPDKSGTLAVVESGTNGSWYYEKWGNGKIEAVFSGSVTYSSMSASGQLYRSTNNAVAIPSGIFSATPQRTEITINNAATVVVCATAKASSATNVNVQIWRSTNATSSIDCTIRCTYIP